jgi:hypothetical protein
VSGRQVTFIGDAMAAVVQGVEEVRALIGQPPVVVGGLAIMCRLSDPHRATTDLDLVDRLLGLQDIARLILDEEARSAALAQLGSCDTSIAADIALHVELWLVDRCRQALRWIHDAGGTDLTLDDLDLIAELLLAACTRS